MKKLSLTLIAAAASTLASAASTTFINPVGPVARSSADPHVMRHSDGNYYYVHTADDWLSLHVAKSPSLSGIGAANSVRVWTAPTGACNGSNCTTKNVWAPELYNFSGVWHLYYAAGGDDGAQRVWVIRNSAADPTTGTWTAPLKVSDSANLWAIDQTLATINGQLYMAWSEISDSGLHQHLRIAKMSNPTTIIGRGALLSVPTTYAWEHEAGTYVNEGPSFITHGNKVMMSFSGSGCWTDYYKLGLLTATIGADLSVPSNWVKSPTPILQQGPGAYGPGHNSFVKSPDGTEDWVVYHANPAPGQGCGNSRTTRIQKINWNGDTPVIGAPSVPGAPVTRPSGEGTADILYRLRNEVSGKVMSVNRGVAPRGANVWQWTDFGNTDQRWALDPAGNGRVRLRSNYNGYVLDVLNWSVAPGAGLVTWDNTGGNNQQWLLNQTANQYFELRNRHSGLLLDNKDWSTADGGAIQQWTGNGLAPQRWRLERVN